MLYCFGRFECQAGFAVVGANPVVCEDDDIVDNRGVWSSDPPVCAPVICLPPHTDPENGNVRCTDENNYLSECR